MGENKKYFGKGTLVIAGVIGIMAIIFTTMVTIDAVASQTLFIDEINNVVNATSGRANNSIVLMRHLITEDFFMAGNLAFYRGWFWPHPASRGISGLFRL